MRILAFSDWRAQEPELPLAVLDQRTDIDLVVYGGDDTYRVAAAASQGDLEDALSAAARIVGGQGSAYRWSGVHAALLEGTGFGAFFADVPDLGEPPLRGDLVRSSDGRLGGIFDEPSLRRLIERDLPAAWACGWTFPVAEDDSDGAPEPSAVALAVAWAAEADVPILLGGPQPADPPADLEDCLRRALGVTAPPVRNRFQDLARRARFGVVGVIGNDCHPGEARYLEGENLHDLHAGPRVIDGWAFLGLQGAPGRLGYTLYSEASAWRHLRHQEATVGDGHHGVIVVTHAPPRGTLDLAARFGVEHIGSKSVARFVARRADLVICGHVHREGGRVGTLGHSTVVNTANHDSPGTPGRLALIDLEPGVPPQVTWLEPDLEGVPVIGPVMRTRLRRRGILTIDALDGLLRTSDPGTKRQAGVVPGLGAKTSQRLALQITALRERRYVPDPAIPVPPRPTGPLLYVALQHETFKARFDGPPRPPRLWCISLLDQDGSEVVHLEAPARPTRRYREELRAALASFVREVSARNPGTLVSWGGRARARLRLSGTCP